MKFVIVLLAVVGCCLADSCSFYNPENKLVYNLNPLLSEPTTFRSAMGYEYLLSYCNTTGVPECGDASFCQMSGGAYYDLGSSTNYALAPLFVNGKLEDGVLMMIEGGYACANGSSRQSRVSILCDPSAHAAMTVEENPLCTYNAVVRSVYGCGISVQ